MTFSQFGCRFSGEVNITFEAEQNGNAINWGGCNEGVFEDDDGNTILDTVSQLFSHTTIQLEVAHKMQQKYLLLMINCLGQVKQIL